MKSQIKQQQYFGAVPAQLSKGNYLGKSTQDVSAIFRFGKPNVDDFVESTGTHYCRIDHVVAISGCHQINTAP